MKKTALFMILSVFLSGCVGAFTPEQVADLQSHHLANDTLARNHRISFVESARRQNEEITALFQGALPDQQVLLNSYRLALASQVDAGSMTPEIADYQMQQRIAQNAAINQQRLSNAIQVASDNIQRSNEQQQQALQNERLIQAAHQPFNCTTTSFGFGLNTACR